MMMKRESRKRFPPLVIILLGILLFSAIATYDGRGTVEADESVLRPSDYLPIMRKAAPITCPRSSASQYSAGLANQYDLDDPVRPASLHADKNLALRGYAPNGDANLQRQLVNYGADDPNQPPQFATLFKPARVPKMIGFYRINDWIWAPSPDPGRPGSPISIPKVTALGLETKFDESIYVPQSGYDIGGGMEVLILYADENSVTLRYTREDSSGAPGYTVHVDNICTDPNLLALYRGLDDPNGPRYKYVRPANRPYSYNLPNLPAGKRLGTAIKGEVVVAISDTGRFWDPRSCNEWWQIRPGYTAACPAPQ